MIKVSVLASGSSGNSIYVKTGSTNLWCDAGVSGKQIAESLAKGLVIDWDLDEVPHLVINDK